MYHNFKENCIFERQNIRTHRRQKNRNNRHRRWISCTAVSITAETKMLTSATKRLLVLATLRSLIRVKSELKGLYSTGVSKHPRALRRFAVIGSLSPVCQQLCHCKTLLSVRWMLACLLTPRSGVLLGLPLRSELFVSMSTLAKPKQWHTPKYSFACPSVSLQNLMSHVKGKDCWCPITEGCETMCNWAERIRPKVRLRKTTRSGISWFVIQAKYY